MISVCMATYNGGKYLKEQVDSILKQLESRDELIVSDDGSTDSTLDVLRSYHDDRIKIFNNDGRKGVVGNFENALSKASGDYIFLCDQDDVWVDVKVERCVEILQNTDLIVHDAVVWNGLQVLNDSFFRIHNSKKGYLNNLIRNSFVGCCMVFRKDILEHALPFPNNIAMHDIYIGLVAQRKFRVTFIEQSLIYFRRHGSNASTTGKKSNLSKWCQFKYRLNMFFATI